MVYSVVSRFSVAVSQFFHCCPIKDDRLKKIRLGYRFRGGRVCFFDFQAHSVEEWGLGRGIGCSAEEDFPIFWSRFIYFGIVRLRLSAQMITFAHGRLFCVDKAN